jgi:DNA-3-methyladenine glycosylase I
MTAALPGADGIPRCPWGNSTEDYAAYHDEEWGVELHGEVALYERLSLEAFQSGLSWLTILRKREGFRRAFVDFEPKMVAEFGEADVERLMNDVSIVRNRAKIEATVRNAQAIAELDVSLDDLLWSFAPDPKSRTRAALTSEIPAITRESKAMARELKKRGFSFVGPTTAYALMQATGMVDDHLTTCWRAEK